MKISPEPNPTEGALYHLDMANNKFILFSDVHKGNRKGRDEFGMQKNYLAALEYYNDNRAYYVNLGDLEEFWKFNIFQLCSITKRLLRWKRNLLNAMLF